MKLDVNDLRSLYALSIERGTSVHFVPLMFNWAESASKVAIRYRDALNKIAERNSSDNPYSELVQIAREALREE